MTRLLVALSLAFVGCADDVGKDKAVATVKEATPAKAKAKAEAKVAALGKGEMPEGAVKLKLAPIDTAQSKIKIVGAKITGSHDITFTGWRGQLRVGGERIVGVDVEIDATTLEADHPKLTKHLKSADFIDVANHPKAGFSSKTVIQNKDGTHTVTGNMTIRGVTKEISFPADLAVRDGVATARAEFVIDRQDFGLAYPGKPDDLIQDNVAFTIELKAPNPS